jgi:hypothetical protein
MSTFPDKDKRRDMEERLKSSSVKRTDGKPWTPQGLTRDWILVELDRVKTAGMTAGEIANTFPHRKSPPNNRELSRESVRALLCLGRKPFRVIGPVLQRSLACVARSFRGLPACRDCPGKVL